MSTETYAAPSRFDLLIAAGIALVSITTAVVVWRGSVVSSSASDASRHQIIEAIKQQAGANEDWREVYQEAGFAYGYAAYAAELGALEQSADAAAQAQAANLRQYMLPSLAQLSPLVSESSYQMNDGTYDLQQRFQDLEAENPDLSSLDPEASGRRADQYSAEQRWLTVDAVLLTISLFWLALAQISGRRLRLAMVTIGGLVFGLALLWLGAVEIYFWVTRGVL